jgi:D-alanine-D-alanine ligase
MSDELAAKGIRMVGQSPKLTEKWDDKANTNLWLATQKGLETAFPKSKIIHKDDMDHLRLEDDGIGWPRVLKPIRGRGSHGVAVVDDEKGFLEHIQTLFAESDAVLMEVSLVPILN